MTYSFEQFVEKSKQIHHDKYRYDLCVFKGYSNTVEIIHGSFWKTPTHHIAGRGCEKCGRANAKQKLKSNTQKFIEKARKLHNDLYSYELVNYVNAMTKISIICKTHGCFQCTPHDHLGGHGCWECFLSKRKHSLEIFISKANAIHNNKYTYDSVVYKNIREKVIITCPIHGKFEQTPDNHLQGRGCPRCIKTYKQHKWLDFIGLPNDKTHREVTLKIGSKKFRVDGYNSKIKTVYEFNGDSWHGNPKMFDCNDINQITKTTYGYLYNKTIQKEEVLKTAGFNVVSIWESDFDIQFNKFQPSVSSD